MKLKLYRAVVGSTSGGFVTAFWFAILSWLVAYNRDPAQGMEGPCLGCAHLAATVAGAMGFMLGLPLGLVINFFIRGLIPGTFLGLALGVVMLVLVTQQGGHPDFDVGNPLVLASIPAGTLSGFFTALIELAISRTEDSPQR